MLKHLQLLPFRTGIDHALSDVEHVPVSDGGGGYEMERRVEDGVYISVPRSETLP